MDFDEYQLQAQESVIRHKDPLIDKTIWAMGIAGEAGEIIEKWKKLVAYKDAKITDEVREDMSKEIGDVLWYLAAFSQSLDLSLQAVAEANLEKVLSRKKRGVIKGKGDNR